MDINLNITLKLDPSIVALLTGLAALAPQTQRSLADPGEEPKRGRKSKDPAPAGASEPSPTPPALAIVAASPAAAAPTAALTLKDLTELVTDTLDKCGTPTLRGIFAKFKVAKISELKPDSYSDFAAALNEARSMVS